jgi:adenosine deaminase
VKEKNVCVECCITSNLLTKAVMEPRLHPLKQYLKDGIAATLGKWFDLIFLCILKCFSD